MIREGRSAAGVGCVITLPLTLAIVDGQTVAVGTQTYIVPLLSIIESMQLKPDMVNRISPDGDAELIVAGVNLIGLAFSASGEMAVVSIDSVYSLATQIKGTLLSV